MLVPQKPDPCVIPRFSDVPPILSVECGGFVCMQTGDAVALSKWIANEMELNRALIGCSLVIQK